MIGDTLYVALHQHDLARLLSTRLVGPSWLFGDRGGDALAESPGVLPLSASPGEAVARAVEAGVDRESLAVVAIPVDDTDQPDRIDLEFPVPIAGAELIFPDERSLSEFRSTPFENADPESLPAEVDAEVFADADLVEDESATTDDKSPTAVQDSLPEPGDDEDEDEGGREGEAGEEGRKETEKNGEDLGEDEGREEGAPDGAADRTDEFDRLDRLGGAVLALTRPVTAESEASDVVADQLARFPQAGPEDLLGKDPDDGQLALLHAIATALDEGAREIDGALLERLAADGEDYSRDAKAVTAVLTGAKAFTGFKSTDRPVTGALLLAATSGSVDVLRGRGRDETGADSRIESLALWLLGYARGRARTSTDRRPEPMDAHLARETSRALGGESPWVPAEPSPISTASRDGESFTDRYGVLVGEDFVEICSVERDLDPNEVLSTVGPTELTAAVLEVGGYDGPWRIEIGRDWRLVSENGRATLVAAERPEVLVDTDGVAEWLASSDRTVRMEVLHRFD